MSWASTGEHPADAAGDRAAEADPGFDRALFASALAAIDRFPDGEFETYGLSGEDIARLREQFRSWADALRDAS